MENKIQNELVLNGVVNIKLHKGMINNIEDNMIVINNEDGTKVVMVLENGEWLQARTESDRCNGGNSYEK